MTKACLYLRVSTAGQETDNQLPALEAYAASKGYEITEIYAETESGWKAGHQHELSRLLDDVRLGKRKYDVVLIFALDRLTRQGALAILNLIDAFRMYNVKVESVKEPFTNLPFGFDSVVYSFLGWAAKYESDRKSQNTKAGLAKAKNKGKILGRPPGSKDKRKRHKKRPVVFRYGGAAV